jgi:SapC
MIHPRISSDGSGAAVFGEGGQPSPYLAEVVEMIGALDEGYRASDEFFAALARYDLFEPFSMDVTLASGAMHRMVGYHLINEDKLAALEPAVLGELHGAGHLGPIYMAIASLGNLGKLVRRKNQQGDG